VTWFSATVNIVDDAGVPELPTGVFVVPGRAGLDTSPPSDGVGVRARYVRITPNWVPIGSYREIARVWLGDAVVIPEGVDANWDLGFVEPGRLDTSSGQQVYEEKKNRVRTLRVSLSKMPAEIAFGFAEGSASAADTPSIEGLQFSAGATGEVVILPRSTSALWNRRLGIYGHIDANSRPTIHHDAGDFYSTEFVAIEER